MKLVKSTMKLGKNNERQSIVSLEMDEKYQARCLKEGEKAMIDNLIQKAKQGLKDYIKQLESVDIKADSIEVELYFQSVLYRDLVDLHRKHNADDATIAGYVRAFNDLVEYQLNLHHFKKELDIILTRPRTEQERKLPILEKSMLNWIASNEQATKDIEVLELIKRLEKAMK